MLVFGDARLPETAKQKLRGVGTFVPFMTHHIVYDAISGHPDIFFCQQQDTLVVAPNLPEKYFERLHGLGIKVTVGQNQVGNKYPETAGYNAVVTDKFFVHNPEITDPVLRNTFSDKKKIAVKQGYVRCNLLSLREDIFLTSDRGIEKVLRKEGLETHYFSPQGILLPGFQHGFLGGCLGIWENKIFITGSLSHYPEGEKLNQLLRKWGYGTVELYDGPLVDGGGLFFIPF